MDFLWVLIAFIFGFLVKQLGLPPLVGYLIAGFSLHALGFEAHASLDVLAELGITLLLFTIGLKLKPSTLLKPEILNTAITHSLLWCLLFLAKWLLLAVVGFSLVSTMGMTWKSALLIAFALSFSSTIGVIKLLEDQDELKTNHGKVAVGILVIQDILAVSFMAIATAKLPSIWAVLLLLLIPLRPLFHKLIDKVGHGELLPLVGFFLALGGAELFSLVNVKGDLGALFLGVLLASSLKANELYKSLISFKDLFLIGFFLSVGFTALPTLELLGAAVLISLLLIIKFALFLALFLFFKMRPRNAFLCAITLSNFSEFGLIVANMAVLRGFLNDEWLVVIAFAVTFSLIISSGIFKYAHKLYARYQSLISSLQFRKNVPELLFDQPEGVKIMIIGFGRVGVATYDTMSSTFQGSVLGIDADEDRVNKYKHSGRQVMLGDGEDADFWLQINLNNIELIMLSTPGVTETQDIIEQIRRLNFKGRIACIARYEDERKQLLEIGADVVFNYFAEVGAGFAEEGKKILLN